MALKHRLLYTEKHSQAFNKQCTVLCTKQDHVVLKRQHVKWHFEEVVPGVVTVYCDERVHKNGVNMTIDPKRDAFGLASINI